MITAAAGNGTDAAGSILGAVFILAMIALYWLPTLVGWRRHVQNLTSVAVINGFLGWSLIGWVVALAMAVRDIPQPPVIEVRSAIPQYDAERERITEATDPHD